MFPQRIWSEGASVSTNWENAVWLRSLVIQNLGVKPVPRDDYSASFRCSPGCWQARGRLRRDRHSLSVSREGRDQPLELSGFGRKRKPIVSARRLRSSESLAGGDHETREPLPQPVLLPDLSSRDSTAGSKTVERIHLGPRLPPPGASSSALPSFVRSTRRPSHTVDSSLRQTCGLRLPTNSTPRDRTNPIPTQSPSPNFCRQSRHSYCGSRNCQSRGTGVRGMYDCVSRDSGRNRA